MITIHYLANLRETLDCSSEQIDWSGGDVAALLRLLRQRGEPWSSALAPEHIYKVAINQEIVHGEQATIAPGAEVAILPPVTGG